jgi:hypothetical protein
MSDWHFKDLIGKRLIGVMELQNSNEERLLFIIEDNGQKKILVADSENKDYSWYDNWKLTEKDQLTEQLNQTYKSIGDEILNVTFEGEEDALGRITADMDKWIKAVGEGSWGATEGAEYWFITIQTQSKVIRLGAQYWVCHYPSVIWDFPSTIVPRETKP